MTTVAKGRCTCGEVSYTLTNTPLFVHCCHCTWCQRETGSAFVLNGLIERSTVDVTGTTDDIMTPSESGKGQIISRCPTCKVALWSVYSGVGDKFLFIRMGTLENPAQFPPDIHIFTSTKQPWVRLPDDVPVCDAYYRRSEMWPDASLKRREAVLAKA